MVGGSTIDAMLAARDLGFSFGSRAVLRDVGLQALPGTRTAIIGPNGSGKSTLLRLLGGHLQPTTGRVSLDGSPVASMPARARAGRIAIVPQALSLAFPFSVARFVSFGRHALGQRGIDRAVADALERVDLADRADDPLGELSQGQQQRASIARALCQLTGMPPGDRCLLADEPTASLDPAHALLVRALFDAISNEGVAVVAALHDLGAAAAFDAVLLLGPDGSPVAAGVPDEVLADGPLHRAFGVRFERLTAASGLVAAFAPSAPGSSGP